MVNRMPAGVAANRSVLMTVDRSSVCAKDHGQHEEGKLLWQLAPRAYFGTVLSDF